SRTERDQLRAPCKRDGLCLGGTARLAEVQLPVHDDHLKIDRSREPPQELPVALVALLEEGVRRPRRIDRPWLQARASGHAPGDVVGGCVLVSLSALGAM